MIIISEIENEFYFSTLTKDKKINDIKKINLLDEKINSDFLDIINQNLKDKNLCYKDKISIFVSDSKVHYLSLKLPKINDLKKLNEFIKWSIKENLKLNENEFEYDYKIVSDELMYVQLIDKSKILNTKEKIGDEIFKKVDTFDSHMFNEIVFLKNNNVIKEEEFIFVKITNDVIKMMIFLSDDSFESYELEHVNNALFMIKTKNNKDDVLKKYNLVELPIVNEIFKKVVDKLIGSNKNLPSRVYILSTQELIYYFKLLLTEHFSDNLNYVNQMVGLDLLLKYYNQNISPNFKKNFNLNNSFNYVLLNFCAITSRWLK